MFLNLIKKSSKITAFALAAVLTFAGPISSVYATETQATSSGQSADAYLKKFSVTPGTVTPSFTSSTTNYTIDIPLESESVSVTCSVANSDSKVIAASGFKNLQPGNNSAYIEVQDVNGGTCKYTFTIVRGGSTGDAATTDPATTTDTTTATTTDTTTATTTDTTTATTTDTTTAEPAETTETAEPAAPESTAPQYDVVKVKEKVNVRSGESTDADKLGQVEGGTELTRYEELESGWSKIDYNGQEGYIKSEFLELVTAGTGAAPATTDPAAADPAAATAGITAEAYSEDMKVNDGSVFNEYYVLPTFDDSILPAGFVSQEYTYRGKTVKSAYFAPGNVRLLYLSLPNNDNIDFRLYYEATDEFMDFWPMTGKDGKFIFPVKYEAQIKTPDNYTNTTLPSDVKVVPAFIYTELTGNKLTVQEGMESKDTLQPGESAADESVDITTLPEEPEFYLMYCVNQDGVENFYLYDWTEDTYQRYVERDTSSELDKSYLKYKTVANRRFAVIAVLIVLLVIALFVIVNLWLRTRDDNGDGGDGGDDEEDDFYARRAKREAAAKERAEAKAKKQAERAAQRARKEQEEADEDDFEEEYEEEPVKEAPVKRKAAESVPEESHMEEMPVKSNTVRSASTVRSAAARDTAEQISRAPRVSFTRPDTGSIGEDESPVTARTSAARPSARTSTGTVSAGATGSVRATVPTAHAKPAVKPEVRTTAPSATGITMTTMPKSKGDLEAEAVAKKLRDTLDIPVVTDSKLKASRAGGKTVKPKRPAAGGGKDDFKMINLSRTSDSSGLDDDFEFEFIKLDDND
ncbi:MAG: SH3 domain-containing protein [Lachnospiraceae bacterium]|nr:SH3 domain-containing protein [Lachnospiraceae bacterium]